MSRPPTTIRRMYGMGPNSLYREEEKRRAEIEALDGCPVYPWLVVADTVAARGAMVKRVAAIYRGFREETIEDMLAIALAPTKQRHP